MIRIDSIPRTDPADGDYPTGKIKDETASGANDGTLNRAVLQNDRVGFDAALMAKAGKTPSTIPDTANASDRLDAIQDVISLYEPISGGGPLKVNRKYLIQDGSTYTLPLTTGLAVKDRVDMVKLSGFDPVIQVDGSNAEVVNYFSPSTGILVDTDTSVSYNIFVPVAYIFDGADWEL